MTGDGRVAYDFAVLRVVPHVHLGDFIPIGVILHARTVEFLGMRALNDPARLRGSRDARHICEISASAESRRSRYSQS